MTFLLTALGLAQAVPIALTPSSQWQINRSEANCLVAREFGTGDDKVTLAFQLTPLGGPSHVMLVGAAPRPWKGGKITLLSRPSGLEITRAATVSTGPQGRPILNFSLEVAELAAIAKEPELVLTMPDNAPLSTTAVDKAFAAAKTCQDELLRSWTGDQTTIATKLKPINPSNWVTEDDYPAGAFRVGAQGVVTFRLNVAADGRVAGCDVLVSSGNREMDEAVCKNMTRRGRFEPAKTADGKPVPSVFLSRFTWRIPR